MFVYFSTAVCMGTAQQVEAIYAYDVNKNIKNSLHVIESLNIVYLTI